MATPTQDAAYWAGCPVSLSQPTRLSGTHAIDTDTPSYKSPLASYTQLVSAVASDSTQEAGAAFMIAP